ncbi:MAG: DUF1330 domain-containing protein [Caulobacteraceae bacterium]|nr:DUF1330 domain-containing protein [Caulobacteraceae bacterium]
MSLYVDPTRERFAVFRDLPSPGPIQMLNLIRFRPVAAYPDGHEQAGQNLTGAQAYRLYGRYAGPVLQRVGGRQIILARPELTLIGPEEERWDLFFIAEYPGVDAFAAMIRDEEYRRAVVHRQAAVEDSRLVRMQPSTSGVRFGEA